MSDAKPWVEYSDIARKTLYRCNMSDPDEQTIHYVAVILWAESELVDLERKISTTSSVNPIAWFKLQQMNQEYDKLSETVYDIQKTTANPHGHLHELIQVDEDGVKEGAISEILTQLGWEFFPRHLNRFLNLYERVGRELNSKKQQLLTMFILLVSSVALLISMATLVVTVVLQSGGNLL